jgi:hypothetical protein
VVAVVRILCERPQDDQVARRRDVGGQLGRWVRRRRAVTSRQLARRNGTISVGPRRKRLSPRSGRGRRPEKCEDNNLRSVK